MVKLGSAPLPFVRMACDAPVVGVSSDWLAKFSNSNCCSLSYGNSMVTRIFSLLALFFL